MARCPGGGEWLQGGESGAGDHGELMMEGDGSGRRVVGAATGGWVENKERRRGRWQK